MPIASYTVPIPKHTTTPMNIGIDAMLRFAHRHKKYFNSHALHLCHKLATSHVYQRRHIAHHRQKEAILCQRFAQKRRLVVGA